MKAVTPERKINEFGVLRNILESMMWHIPIVDEEDQRERRKYDEAMIEMVCFALRGEIPKALKGWALDFFRDVYRLRLKLTLSETLEAISGVYREMTGK